MPGLFTGVPREPEQLQVAPGAVLLKNWVSLEQQVQLVERCQTLLAGPGGGYIPTVRGGGKMHVQMMCLGQHWNPLTYSTGLRVQTMMTCQSDRCRTTGWNLRQQRRARLVSACARTSA